MSDRPTCVTLYPDFVFLPWVQRKTRPVAEHPHVHFHCSPPTGEPTLHGRAESENQNGDKERGMDREGKGKQYSQTEIMWGTRKSNQA